MLNSSKGTTVQGPRVQAERKRYKAAIHALLDDQPNLQIIEAEAAALHMTDNSVTGLYLADRDRKRVWEGQGVSVPVSPGATSIVHKKKKNVKRVQVREN